MNDTLARILLAIAAFLFAALVMGVFAGSARGVVLCSVGLLCLAACRIKIPSAVPLEATLAPPIAPPVRRSFWRRTLDRLAGAPEARAARGTPSSPGAPYGVCVLDEEFRILWCNGSAAGHFGIRPSAATGLPAARVIFADQFDAYLAAGNFARPLKLERAEGTILSIALVPHLHSQWLLLSRDVTLETRTEVLRRDGVADALHELCTPVTVLAGHLDTLRRVRLDPWRSSDCLQYMEQQCRRMQATIGDLVNLWTLDSAPPPAEERVDVPALLAQIRSDIAALSGGRHHIALDARPGVGLYGSASEIASAFGNLATNAIRYTPQGGAVWIVWRQTGDGAELTVEDNGIGIAKEHVPRLTERFYQVDRAQSRALGGSGLGLAIVKSILARYKATLEIDSEPGRGSRFSAKFPAGRVLIMTTPPPVEVLAWPEEEPELDAPGAPPSPAAMRLPDIGGKAPAPL